MKLLNMKFTYMLAVIIFIPLTASVAKPSAQNTDSLRNEARFDSSKIKSPTGALIRSLVFPGLGQWYNGKKLKAVAVFLGETGLLANAIYLNQKLVKSKTEYEREYYINNRNLSVWWLIGVMLYSAADAYVDAHLSDFDESPDLSTFKIEPFWADHIIGFKAKLHFSF